MTEAAWRLGLVELSDSFRLSVAALTRELGAAVSTWKPHEEPTPSGVAAVLVMAGGAEGMALDLLADLLGAAVPVYLIGAAPDHRLAAAVQRGARDYFALPDDMDVLRRSLPRLLPDSRYTSAIVATTSTATARSTARIVR